MNLLKNKFLKNFLVYLTSGGIAKALPMIVLPIIANLMSPADFGLVSNFNTLVNLSAALISLRLMAALQADYYKAENNHRSQVSNILIIWLGITVVLVLLVLLFSGLINKYFGLALGYSLLAIFVGIGKNIQNIQATLYRLKENSKNFAIFVTVGSLLTASLTLFLIIGLKYSWEGRIFASAGSTLIMLIIALILLVRKKLIHLRPNIKRIKSYFKFGIPLIPQSISPFLRNGINKLIITNDLGLAANGIFSLAMTVGMAFSMFLLAFYSAFIPHLYKKVSAIANFESLSIEAPEKKRIVREGYWGIFFFIVVFCLGFMVLKILGALVLKDEYLEAINYLPWFILDVFLLGLFQLLQAFIMYVKRTKAIGAVTFGTAIIQAILAAILIPLWGVYAAIFSMLTTSFIRLIITYFLAQRYFPMPWKIILTNPRYLLSRN